MNDNLIRQARDVLAAGGKPALDEWVQSLTKDQQERLLVITFEAAIRLDEWTKIAGAQAKAPNTDE